MEATETKSNNNSGQKNESFVLSAVLISNTEEN